MRTIVIGGAVFAICVACACFWLFHGGIPNEKSFDTNQAPQTTDATWPTIKHQKKSNTLSASQDTDTAAPSVQNITSNVYEPRVLKEWQAAIEFYGKVVDGSSNPVSEVKIHFRWTESPGEDGEKTADAQTGADGQFSLHDKHGASLDISFGKDGYYSAERGHRIFNYALAQNILSPDPQNPIVFILQKKGNVEPLIKKKYPPGMSQIAQLHRDGTPVEIDLLTGERASPGTGQLILESWRNSGDKGAKVFDWKLVLSVPSGGLIATTDEFAFQAPDTGYQPLITIDMPATNQNWLSQLKNRYYIHLPDGTYGRFDLYFLPYNGVFTVNSAVNPSGSRNLESDN